MRAVKSVSIDSDNRVTITYLDGSTEILFPEHIDYDEAISLLNEQVGELNDDVGELKENLNENVSELKSALSVLKEATTTTKEEQTTETVALTWNDGYVTTSGVAYSNASYKYSYIDVMPGDVVTMYRGDDNPTVSVRFLASFVDNVANPGLGGENLTPTFTVAEGVNKIAVSVASKFFSYGDVYCTIKRSIEPLVPIHQKDIFILKKRVKKSVSNKTYKFNLVGGNAYVTADDFQNMNSYAINFKADISTITSEIKILKGSNSNYGGGIGIDGTNIYEYLGTSTTPVRIQAHGLTFKDYISVTLAVSDGKPAGQSANVVICTNGGKYTWGISYFASYIGAISISTSDNYNNCVLTYECNALNKPTWLYGDSYFGYSSDKRWTHYLYEANYQNFMLNGYPGRGSQAALTSLKLDISMGIPLTRIVWCLGMNDRDNGAINPNWLSAVTEVIEICENNDIELILATIPNVPTVDNSYKNAYVRNSGYRYIDFAKAVGAENDTTWFDNMLSADGVHPDVQGAIALYAQAIADVPELTQ